MSRLAGRHDACHLTAATARDAAHRGIGARATETHGGDASPLAPLTAAMTALRSIGAGDCVSSSRCVAFDRFSNILFPRT
jgi:hypothetical protein